MALRFFRFAFVACAVAVMWALVPPLTPVVHAEAPTGSCRSSAYAAASSYDGTMSGSAVNDVYADGYSLSNCNGLSQTNAIFTAGLACQNAGIPAGGEHGIGYAVVDWTAVWQNSATGEVTVIGPVQQQYDCGDTFS